MRKPSELAATSRASLTQSMNVGDVLAGDGAIAERRRRASRIDPATPRPCGSGSRAIFAPQRALKSAKIGKPAKSFFAAMTAAGSDARGIRLVNWRAGRFCS